MFRYDFDQKADAGIIKIHFKNKDTSGKGPLSKERQQIRLEEVKQLFQSIKKKHPEAKIVCGGSWLYNLESYRRLFPNRFTENMKVEEVPFPRTTGIWGQFLNSEGKLHDKMKHAFLHKINKAENVAALLQCFEFRILFAEAEIENFYSHFSIT